MKSGRSSTPFGGDCAKPTTVSGALHAEPASGSMLAP